MVVYTGTCKLTVDLKITEAAFLGANQKQCFPLSVTPARFSVVRHDAQCHLECDVCRMVINVLYSFLLVPGLISCFPPLLGIIVAIIILPQLFSAILLVYIRLQLSELCLGLLSGTC